MFYGVDLPVHVTRIQNDFKLHISKSVGLNAKSLRTLFKFNLLFLIILSFFCLFFFYFQRI